MLTWHCALCICWLLLFACTLYALLSASKNHKPSLKSMSERIDRILRQQEETRFKEGMKSRDDRRRQEEDHQYLVQMSEYVTGLKKRFDTRRLHSK